MGPRSASLVLVALAACTSLGDVDRNLCGNGVLEPGQGEDCDHDDATTCGAPDTAAACRLRCGPSVEGAPACPGGASCGLDGVCHAPGGGFAITAEDAWTSRQLLVGDTTGDVYPELIGVGDTQLDVRLGGPDGTFAASVVGPNLPVYGAPRAGDVDGDGLTDVVVPVGIGLFTLVGDPVTTLQPVLQDSFILPATGPVALTSVAYESGTGNDQVPATTLLAVVHLSQGPGCPLPAGCNIVLLGDGGVGLPPGHSADRLVRDEVPWTPFPGGPEGRIIAALAFRDDPSTIDDEGGLFIYHGDAVAQTLAQVAEVTGFPGRVDRGVWFADLDRDARGDLLISTVDGPFGEAVMVAWGRADGSFEPPVYLIGGPGPSTTPAATIAWADLDLDGDADVVTTSGVYFINCLFRVCTFTVGSGQDRAWDGAVVGDFDGDGRPDVAAFSRTGVTIDVLLGTGARGFWNEAPLPAPGAVSRLRSGDFDGNSVGDLALVAAPYGTTGADEIHVAFGRASQPPAPPAYMGFVGTVVALDRAQAPLPGRLDTIDDLLVAKARDGATGIAVVLGSTSQRMIAPLIPAARAAGGLSIVEAAVSASLDGDAFDDVICLLTEFDVDGGFRGNTVRVYTSDGTGALTERTPAGGIDLATPEFAVRGASWAVIPGSDARSSTVAGIDPLGRMVTVRVACSATGCTMDTPLRLLDGSEVGEPTGLLGHDLDGDGDLDLVASFRAVGDEPAGVRVWRDGGGAAAVVAAPAGVNFVDVAAADLDLDGGSTLILVGRDDGGARIYTSSPAADGSYGAAAADPRFDAGSNVANGFFVHAGDLTGDGLPDVAVISGGDRSTPRVITVFTQAEARGALAEAGTR